jgi:hypothetical protein
LRPDLWDLLLADADRVADDDLACTSFVTQIGEPFNNLVEKRHCVEGRRCGSVSGVLISFGADLFELTGHFKCHGFPITRLSASLRDETDRIREPPICS